MEYDGSPLFVSSRRSSPPPLPPGFRRSAASGRSVEMRVFWGVFCALTVFALVVVVGLLSVAFFRAEHQRAVMQGIDDYAQRTLQQEQQQRAQQLYFEHQQQQEQAMQLSAQALRRQLASNERCMGGMVIRQVGSTYTQLGGPGDPVRCSGRLADRPIH